MKKLTIIIPFILLFNTSLSFGEEYAIAPFVEAEYMAYDELRLEENTIEIYPNNQMTYEEALLKAKAENKLLMFSIRATNCKYCDRMEEETLSDITVVNRLNENFITLYYNQDEDQLPLNLQPNMTPNFVFVNQNEDIIDISLGRQDSDEFLELLDTVLMESI
jgi:thioredoxin-related protein